MKTLFLSFVFAFVFIFAPVQLAFGQTALTGLTTIPSIKQLGMGGAGVAFPHREGFNFFFNPAQLGLSSRITGLNTQFSRFSNFDGSSLETYALQGGYDFSQSSYPISLGIGLFRTHNNLGEVTFTNEVGANQGTFLPTETYYGLSVGASYGRRWKLSLGTTLKLASSDLTNDILKQVNDRIVMFDYGLLGSGPAFDARLGSRFRLIGNISLGYAVLNVGGKFAYLDPTQADPLPRTVKLGYAAVVEGIIQFKSASLRAFRLDWTAEANDLLVNTTVENLNGTPTLKQDYQYLLGDIKLWDNLVRLRSDDRVSTRFGARVSLFETVQFSLGKHYFLTLSPPLSWGFAVQTGGIFKLLLSESTRKSPLFAIIGNIEFFWSEFNRGIFTDQRGWGISLSGLNVGF
jgi:hypothetical protein